MDKEFLSAVDLLKIAAQHAYCAEHLLQQNAELIIENQIIIVTGRAGSGKSLVCALTALDFLNKKQCDQVFDVILLKIN